MIQILSIPVAEARLGNGWVEQEIIKTGEKNMGQRRLAEL